DFDRRRALGDFERLDRRQRRDHERDRPERGDQRPQAEHERPIDEPPQGRARGAFAPAPSPSLAARALRRSRSRAGIARRRAARIAPSQPHRRLPRVPSLKAKVCGLRVSYRRSRAREKERSSFSAKRIFFLTTIRSYARNIPKHRCKTRTRKRAGGTRNRLFVMVNCEVRDARPHPEERACRRRSANSNLRTRVSKDEGRGPTAHFGETKPMGSMPACSVRNRPAVAGCDRPRVSPVSGLLVTGSRATLECVKPKRGEQLTPPSRPWPAAPPPRPPATAKQ